ncbi:MAG: thymidine kinase [Erysipelotrichaceae bacterium]|nr:thymidine kinase [Erysipelotrichaceae bacterium]MBQ1304467.1 thymidine kinase [Erysipelotrichaceae bacterium]MBR3352878.1 thymidine kinase [Erysipelotrichaceae bacterium]
MAKLYFKFGAMGSSKTANALMTRFNYQEKGKKVWLIKPAIDNRDGETVLRSRVGLEANAQVIKSTDRILDICPIDDIDVIICDESQFLTPQQVDDLRLIVSEHDIPVLCFGLRSDFLTHLFPGSQRLFELADSITEIKSICRCGAKATVNARFDGEGNIQTSGEQVFIGGNESYESMCWSCYHKMIMEKGRR